MYSPKQLSDPNKPYKKDKKPYFEAKQRSVSAVDDLKMDKKLKDLLHLQKKSQQDLPIPRKSRVLRVSPGTHR